MRNYWEERIAGLPDEVKEKLKEIEDQAFVFPVDAAVEMAKWLLEPVQSDPWGSSQENISTRGEQFCREALDKLVLK